MTRQTRSTVKRVTRLRPSTPQTVPPLTSIQSTTLETRLFANPQEWESYLAAEHLTNSSGLWLKIAKKSSSIPSITYDQALDIALCHGWIDGQRKALDGTHFLQRFTPRRKRSLWSQRNVKKVAALIAEGKMTPAGQAEIDAARKDGRLEKAYSSNTNASAAEEFQQALEDIVIALRKQTKCQYR